MRLETPGGRFAETPYHGSAATAIGRPFGSSFGRNFRECLSCIRGCLTLPYCFSRPKITSSRDDIGHVRGFGGVPKSCATQPHTVECAANGNDRRSVVIRLGIYGCHRGILPVAGLCECGDSAAKSQKEYPATIENGRFGGTIREADRAAANGAEQIRLIKTL